MKKLLLYQDGKRVVLDYSSGYVFTRLDNGSMQLVNDEEEIFCISSSDTFAIINDGND